MPAPRPAPESTSTTALSLGFEPSADGFERTPNGLRKRLSRKPRPAVTPHAPRSEPSAPVVDSPAEVGVRLTALRDGIQRGNAHRLRRP